MKYRAMTLAAFMTIAAAAETNEEPVAPETTTEENAEIISVNGTLVRSYIWRGMYQSGAAFQPGVSLNTKGVSLGVWGYKDFTGQGHKEFDINLSWSGYGVTVSLSDY